MIFSHPDFFLVFLPIALLGFQILGRFGRSGAIGFLAFMSFVFYAQWSLVFLWLLVGSILFNFCVMRLIARNAGDDRAATGWLVFGIVSNLAALCYYKYLFSILGFFSDHGLLRHDFGSVILPLGISFFTFTQIAYLVDLKQGGAVPESLLNYSLFVTFFPHLIAGPILNHKEMMPQFRQERRYQLDRDDVALGLTWFTMGMFKKVMVADRISPVADALFKNPHAGVVSAWIGVLSYSLQLYFDFSGYSDMAVGLARMFSIRFPLNFNSPYKAANIIDFWQRWHMTLTHYIMDYVYGPVQLHISRSRLKAGRKVSKKAMATPEGFLHMVAWPMLFTMFLAGVWHGAGKQFLVFGVLHGTYLVINHAWRIFVPHDSKLQKLFIPPVGMALTYFAVLAGQIFFGAGSVRASLSILSSMIGRNGFGLLSGQGARILLLAALYAVIWLMPNTQELLGEEQRNDARNWSILPHLRWRPTLPWLVATSAAFMISMFYSTAGSTFLYFQF
jgi:D-alanyl-lipoteichoic acid acyltransferase DltB (MBOAT superfamily)